MRIPLELRGLASTIDGLNAVADAFDRVADSKAAALAAGQPDPSMVAAINNIGSRHYLGRGILSDPNATQPLASSAITQRLDPASNLSVLVRELIETNRTGFAELVINLRTTRSSGGGRGPGRTPPGGLANLQRREQEYQDALRSGDSTALRDSRVRLAQARQRVQREDRMLQGPSFTDRLEKVIASTRVNFGGHSGGASPLVGQVASLLGVTGGPLMAFTGGLVVGAAGLKLLADITLQAGRNLQVVGQSRSVTGGSSADVLAFRQFGMDAGTGASAAEAFRQRAQSDQMTKGARAQLGLGPVSSSPYANVNSADVLNETLDALAQVTDRERQLSIARRLGLEGQLDELRVSPAIRASRKKHSEELLRMIPPQAEGQARDLSATIADIGSAWNDLTTVFSAEMMDEALLLATDIKNMLHGAIPIVQELGQAITRPFELLKEALVRQDAKDSYWKDKPRVARDVLAGRNPAEVAEQEGEKAVSGYRTGKQLAEDYLRMIQADQDQRSNGGGRMNPEAWRNLNRNDFNNQSGGANGFGRLGGDASASNPVATAAGAQIAALQANTEALVALRGEFGGGTGVRDAIPAAFLASDPGSTERKLMELMAFRMGHFA